MVGLLLLLVRGVTKGGTPGAMFTLPVGFRPPGIRDCGFATNNSNNPGILSVDPATGDVNSTGAGNTYVYCDPIVFSVTA
jgi:hypothetical protein